MTEQYDPSSGDTQIIFATVAANCYYRIFRRRGSSTYRVELKTPDGYRYTAGLATQGHAEQWAKSMAEELE